MNTKRIFDLTFPISFNNTLFQDKSINITETISLSSVYQRTQTLQSCSPQGILSIFHLSAHRLISLIISTRSIPLSVRVYSHFTGNADVSMVLVMIPSSSSSLSRSERIFGVISERASFSSENLRV